MQEGGEGVREVQNARRGDDGGETRKIRDGGADDEGDGPVDGDDGDPEHLARSLGEWWGAEEFDADVVVQDFDADVAVERGGDEGRHHREDVARGLPAIGADAEVGGVLDVLALVAVHE